MADSVLPITLHFPGGQSVAAGYVKEGSRWRLTSGAYPGHVATGTNIVRVREELERKLAPLVAADAKRRAAYVEAEAPVKRGRWPRRRPGLVDREAQALAEAAHLLGVKA